jgi:hypothetical protein
LEIARSGAKARQGQENGPKTLLLCSRLVPNLFFPYFAAHSRAMGNGQWAMGNGQWAMGNGEFHFGIPLLIFAF